MKAKTKGLLTEVMSFVQEVMSAYHIQATPHVTEVVLTAIANNHTFLSTYNTFLTNHKRMTINQCIGRSAERLTGMESANKHAASLSGIAGTYTILRSV